MKRFSFIKFSPRSLRIKLGCITNCEIAFSNIKDVTTVTYKSIYGIGVRVCGSGEVAIVTTTGEVVRLELKEKGFLKLFGVFKMSFDSLRLSPEREREFIEMLKQESIGQSA